ncbi:MAG: chemotaxis protein CheX [Spirochaetales bacterium]|nr:chemotaxis protein CheX [Spirochaetales bacterium]
MRNFSDFMKETLHLSADREAYGPSRNEGLCYESCQSISFSGEIEGTLFLGLDGYTKLKLLPRVAERYNISSFPRGLASSVLMEFSNQLGGRILTELEEGGFHLQLHPPEVHDHKIVPFDLSRFREYIIVFFLRDRRQRMYLGRAYLTILFRKY